VTRRGKLPPVGGMSLVRRIGARASSEGGGRRPCGRGGGQPANPLRAVGLAGARARVGAGAYGRTRTGHHRAGRSWRQGPRARVADSGSLSAARRLPLSLSCRLQRRAASARRQACWRGCSGERRLAIWLVHGDDADARRTHSSSGTERGSWRR